MKVAVIGNMNNNGFALMRYFRDLGLDCYLLLLADDGKWSFKHFSVDADTWELHKWGAYIVRTNIYTGYKAIFGNPKRLKLPVSKKYIKNLLDGFDVVIGSGSIPALFARHNLSLDVFFPYSIGVEYLGAGPTKNRAKSRNFILKRLVEYTSALQQKGIKNTKAVFNADTGLTESVLNKIGVKSKCVPIPMLYNCGGRPPKDHRVWELAEKLKANDFVVFSHARHLWVKKPSYSDSEWFENTKNNDWLIYGVNHLRLKNPDKKICLLLVEYGDDYRASKKLAVKLGLNEHIVWLPKMERREIMFLLKYASVGVGEFYNTAETLWGGTGWEVLASGKPLLQSFRYEKDRFYSSFNYSPPQLLNVLKKEDVFNLLQENLDDPESSIRLGQAGKEWFDKYSGVELAKNWVSYMKELKR